MKENFFAAEGVNVELVHGGYDAEGNYIEVLPRVLSGEAQFGLAGADQLLQARANGEPLVAIAALYQQTPNSIISLSTSQIVRPEDLKGKRLLLWGEDSTYDIFLHNNGLNHTDLIEVQDSDMPKGYSFDYLLDGSVDAMIGYVTHELLQLRRLVPEDQINTLVFVDYGVDLYSLVFFTTEEMIRTQPAVVQGVVNATLRGWEYAIAQPERLSEYVSANYPSDLGDAAFTIRLIQAGLPLIQHAGGQIGHMDPAVWQDTQDVMRAVGLLSEAVDVTRAFDPNFVETYYRAASAK